MKTILHTVFDWTTKAAIILLGGVAFAMLCYGIMALMVEDYKRQQTTISHSK